jgi:hypothetical protein
MLTTDKANPPRLMFEAAGGFEWNRDEPGTATRAHPPGRVTKPLHSSGCAQVAQGQISLAGRTSRRPSLRHSQARYAGSSWF